MRRTILFLLAVSLCWADLVEDVRGSLDRGDVASASAMIKNYRATKGVTSEMTLAVSWMARGALARKDLTQAEQFSQQTYQLCLDQLKKRPLDRDADLPLALGAAIEVQGNVLAAQGRGGEAVAYLQKQLATYRATSIRTRIQKNINLLSLEGKPAPPLEKIALPKGKPVLLFFWAHWCPDCKGEVPILEKLKKEFEPQGLALITPTQKYGYAANGEDAAPEVETRYIEQIRQKFYATVMPGPAPVSEENFRNYGASSTPTIVLVDRGGVVRLFHPGAMTYEELRPRIAAIVNQRVY